MRYVESKQGKRQMRGETGKSDGERKRPSGQVNLLS